MTFDDQKRHLWADALKIVAVYAVILIHSAAPLLLEYEYRDRVSWWVGNLYDSSARWCIPVFVMLSGTFLLEKVHRHGTKRFLRRRFERLCVPFLVWSTLYLLWRVYINGEPIALSAFPLHIVAGPTYYHLWFIYMMVALYLLAPVLGCYLQHARGRNRLYFPAIWLVFGSILPTLEPLLGWTLMPHVLPGSSVLTFAGYFVLGHLLRDALLSPHKRTLFSAVFVAGLTVTAVGTFYRTVLRNGGMFDGVFYEYHSVSVVAMAVALYLMVKSTHAPPLLRDLAHRTGGVRYLADTVPGIYLVHAMVIAVLRRGMTGVSLSPVSCTPLVGVPLFATVVFALSLGIVAVIRALPVVRWSVP